MSAGADPAVPRVPVVVVLTSVVSAVGICERTKMESGGIYFLISHVLGSQVGGSVGLVYCFGQVSHPLPLPPPQAC